LRLYKNFVILNKTGKEKNSMPKRLSDSYLNVTGFSHWQGGKAHFLSAVKNVTPTATPFVVNILALSPLTPPLVRDYAIQAKQHPFAPPECLSR
jgi:hypothetical protein